MVMKKLFTKIFSIGLILLCCAAVGCASGKDSVFTPDIPDHTNSGVSGDRSDLDDNTENGDNSNVENGDNTENGDNSNVEDGDNTESGDNTEEDGDPSKEVTLPRVDF